MKKIVIKDKIEGNELDLSLNGLTDVPVPELANAPKATHLDLSCNKIRSLPNNFASLTHLVKIDLSKNLLTELPQNFGNLTNLVYLDLYGNHITLLPVSFCHLKSLKWLDLKNNPLSPRLKEIAGDCLDQKQCQACAKNVVSFMQTIESELERQKQKRLKEERAKEAARLAKEQEELAVQRRLKKADREKRKAEARAKRSGQGKVNENGESTNHENLNVVAEEKHNAASKSSVCWKTCCIGALMLPVLLVCCVVTMHLFHSDFHFESLSSFLQEAHTEFQDMVHVWWNAFALPHVRSFKSSLQNWLQSIS